MGTVVVVSHKGGRLSPFITPQLWARNLPPLVLTPLPNLTWTGVQKPLETKIGRKPPMPQMHRDQHFSRSSQKGHSPLFIADKKVNESLNSKTKWEGIPTRTHRFRSEQGNTDWLDSSRDFFFHCNEYSNLFISLYKSVKRGYYYCLW